jgi:hypothetical protein
MKRAFLLIFAVLLLLDLADDGYLGKVKFVPPHSSAKTSLTSTLQSNSGGGDLRYTMPSPAHTETCDRKQFQPILLRVHPTLKIIFSCSNGSSGGIPL